MLGVSIASGLYLVLAGMILPANTQIGMRLYGTRTYVLAPVPTSVHGTSPRWSDPSWWALVWAWSYIPLYIYIEILTFVRPFFLFPKIKRLGVPVDAAPSIQPSSRTT